MSLGTLYGTLAESNGLYGLGESNGLYGIGNDINYSTYFEWFIFTEAASPPATPTGGSWDFLTNIGIPPVGWSSSIGNIPLGTVWMSIAFIDSRNPAVVVWSTPGILSDSSVYATAYADVFTGNGSTVNWIMTANPVVVNNLDVSINGVTQTPNTDYTFSGTTFTTTTAAPLGSIILVKYKQSLPAGFSGTASQITNIPAGGISATNVQTALNELDTEKATVVALAATNANIAILNGATGSANVGYTPAGTGAVATTVQTKLRENVSVKDFGAVGDGVTDDTAAIQAALNASQFVTVPQGLYRITSTIIIPSQTHLLFDRVGGSTNATYPSAQFLKAASMTTHGIQVGTASTLENGCLYGETGNTGDGVVLAGNSAKVIRFVVGNVGGDGFRVSTSIGSTNLNNCEISFCVARTCGGNGLYIHDSRNIAPDANLITVTQFFAQLNGGDGIKLGHCQWVTLLNCLTEVNGGWGLNLSNVVMAYDTVAECKYNTIVGGDFNESNTLGSLNFGGYQNMLVGAYTGQNIVSSGLRNTLLTGGFGSYIERINVPQVVFPAVQVPSTNVNTLDDYEEGTFTPTIIGLTTAGVGTYFTQIGTYTKVGNLVTYAISLIWTAHTGTGGMRINGLPFTATSTDANPRYSAAITWNELTYTSTPMAFVVGTTSQVYLRQGASNATATDIPMDTQASMWICGSYTV